ncbi:hypothetical protein Tco_0353308 [Tanacetum coccineum]
MVANLNVLSLPKGLVLLTSIASSLTKSSSSSGDVLGREGVSSNVTFKDSSTFIACLLRIIVRFFLSTTTFDYGVLGAEKW